MGKRTKSFSLDSTIIDALETYENQSDLVNRALKSLLVDSALTRNTLINWTGALNVEEIVKLGYEQLEMSRAVYARSQQSVVEHAKMMREQAKLAAETPSPLRALRLFIAQKKGQEWADFDSLIGDCCNYYTHLSAEDFSRSLFIHGSVNKYNFRFWLNKFLQPLGYEALSTDVITYIGG